VIVYFSWSFVFNKTVWGGGRGTNKIGVGGGAVAPERLKITALNRSVIETSGLSLYLALSVNYLEGRRLNGRRAT
jgi:hypothetical protein